MFLLVAQAVARMLPQLKEIFHPQLSIGGGGVGHNKQSLLTEHVNR